MSCSLLINLLIYILFYVEFFFSFNFFNSGEYLGIDFCRNFSCRASKRKNKANRYMILLADGGMIMMVRVSVGQVGIYKSISNFHDISSVNSFSCHNVKIYIYFLM